MLDNTILKLTLEGDKQAGVFSNITIIYKRSYKSRLYRIYNLGSLQVTSVTNTPKQLQIYKKNIT